VGSQASVIAGNIDYRASTSRTVFATRDADDRISVLFRERSHCTVLVLWQHNERDVYMNFGSRDVNVVSSFCARTATRLHLTIKTSSYLFSLTSTTSSDVLFHFLLLHTEQFVHVCPWRICLDSSNPFLRPDLLDMVCKLASYSVSWFTGVLYFDP
jgi:hypothetical protein